MPIRPVEHSESGSSHVRWNLVIVMCVASFVSYVLRTNLSISGEILMHELGLTAIQLGIALSAFTWGYAIFQFPGGVFGDIVGSRKALTILAVLWGVLTVFTGLIPGPSTASVGVILAALVAIRFLVGATHAPIFPVIGGAIGNWFPISGWALPNGLTSTSLTLGAAATGPLIVWLLGAYGWRESFILTAPLGLIAAAFWWWQVRDYPVEHSGVSKKELELIDAGRQPPLDMSRQKGSWKLVIRDRNVILLTLSYFCNNYVFYIFFNWFYIYMVDVRGVGREEAGYLTAAQWVVGAMGGTVGGYLCDVCARRLGPRRGYRLVPVPSLILAAVLLLAGAVVKSPLVAVLLLAVCCGLQQVTDPIYWGAIVSVAGRHAAAASGVMNTGGNAVGGFVAILVPVTAKYFGWVAAIGTGSVFAVLSALLWLLVKADQPMAQQEPAPAGALSR